MCPQCGSVLVSNACPCGPGKPGYCKQTGSQAFASGLVLTTLSQVGTQFPEYGRLPCHHKLRHTGLARLGGWEDAGIRKGMRGPGPASHIDQYPGVVTHRSCFLGVEPSRPFPALALLEHTASSKELLNGDREGPSHKARHLLECRARTPTAHTQECSGKQSP